MATKSSETSKVTKTVNSKEATATNSNEATATQYIIDSVIIKGGKELNIGHKEIVVMVIPKNNENNNKWVSLGTVTGDAGNIGQSLGEIEIFGEKKNIQHALVAECIKCYTITNKQKCKPKITYNKITSNKVFGKKKDSIRILFKNDCYRAVCNRNRLQGQANDVSIEVRNFGTTSLRYKTKKRRTGFTGTSEHLMHITKIKQKEGIKKIDQNKLEITEITSEMMKDSFSSGMLAHEHPKDFLIAAICYMNNMNKIEDYKLQFIGDNTFSANGVSNKSTKGGKTRRFRN